MSQITSAAISGVSRIGPTNQPSQAQAGASADTEAASTSSSASAAATSSVDSSSRVTSQSLFSSSSFVVERGSANDKLASLVMMLIQSLLGNNKDDNKDKKDPLLGLAALAMFSALDPATGRFSYFQSRSSQASRSVTTSNSSAVQAVAYQQSAGNATSGAGSLGGTIDTAG